MVTADSRDAAGAAAWCATEQHPSGTRVGPVFEIVGSMVYPAAGHPSGASVHPWYQLRGDLAFPVDAHPDGPSSEPAFRVSGIYVFPAQGADALGTNPDDAWFEISPG